MTGARRTGVNLDARAAELERTLADVHEELDRLTGEHERYRVALGRIVNGEPFPQWIARDALHPPADGEAW